MVANGFNKLYWGFLFILIDFRINGFDILPDIIGYILFAFAFSALASGSSHFVLAGRYNIPMIILSLFSIYEKPAQGGGVQLGSLGWFGLLLSLAAIIVNLLMVYHVFLGIREMADIRQKPDISQEADLRWRHYLGLSLAALLSFILIFIPVLGFIYIIILVLVAVVLTYFIMKLMRRCELELSGEDSTPPT